MEHIVAQRRDTDCAVAALAWFYRIRYEDAFVAAVTVEPDLIKRGGLTIGQMQLVAERLGCKLKRVHWKKVDLDDDVGILIVNWNHPENQNGATGHAVVLRKGTIICPRLPSAWDAEEYLKVEDGRIGTLLVSA